MGYPEIDRLEELEKRLIETKRRHKRAYKAWAKINNLRKSLDKELNFLINEKDLILQGQLFLKVG